jgi:hypothetical protein
MMRSRKLFWTVAPPIVAAVAAGWLGFWAAARSAESVMILGSVANASWHVSFIEEIKKGNAVQAAKNHERLLRQELDTLSHAASVHPELTDSPEFVALARRLRELRATYSEVDVPEFPARK